MKIVKRKHPLKPECIEVHLIKDGKLVTMRTTGKYEYRLIMTLFNGNLTVPWARPRYEHKVYANLPQIDDTKPITMKGIINGQKT